MIASDDAEPGGRRREAAAGSADNITTFTAKGPVGGVIPGDRADVIAQLAARMAMPQPQWHPPADHTGAESADRAQAARPSDRAPAGDEPGGAFAAARGGRRGDDRGRGSSRRRARPGSASAAPGHPEDDPGDPAVLAKAICLRLLAISARPRAGLAQALARKGIPDDVAETVLDRLTRVGLIDDEAYAAAFVRTKHRDRALGRAGLGQELRRKGVDPELVSAAVAEIDPGAERQRARALVASRLDAAMAAGPVAARRRLAGLLARRGYAAGVAYEVVGEAVESYIGEDSATDGGVVGWESPDDD